MFSWLQDLISWMPLGLPAFLVVVTIVVFFHELGHFLVARACGVGIKTFSIGFGGEIFGWNDRHGTHWKVAWLPLGGYVEFLGDAGAASTPDRTAIAAMSESDRAKAFHLKPLLQRALVVAAGPIANFLLAIVVFTGLYAIYGVKTLSTVVGAVVTHSPAEEAGILPGDKIVAVNGRQVRMFVQLQIEIQRAKARPMTLSVVRDGQARQLELTARTIDNKDIFGQAIRTTGIGVAPGEPTADNTVYVPLPLWKAPIAGASQSYGIAALSMSYLWRMVSRHADPKQLSGPVGMAKFAKTAASHGIYDFLNLIAFISVSIGLINLFPIPLLDGGHLLYYGCEAVLGRPVKEKVQEVGFRFGLVLVLGLMIFATLNDLIR
jgi:regulator of sigma E protease